MDGSGWSVPLRTADVDLDELLLVFTATDDRWGIDIDWKEWRAVVEGLRQALRERGCRVPFPICSDASDVDGWLEEVNALIADASAFPEGHAYELLDLAPGGDTYTILLRHGGTTLSGNDAGQE